MRTPVLATFMALFVCTAALTTETSLDDARQCFDRYVALQAAFDPAVADLYSDDAKIQNTRVMPSGEKRVMTLPAPAYKGIIRQVMPVAKERGDTSKYSEVKYAKEGDKVRVTATRYSELKKYSSPLSLLVGPNKDGAWLIHEELSESRP
ncbi:hypothetical protein [Roseimicrobium gellanilyticum]|nr:hypothetical protein [Roseimicrobium gellanilyticum]